MMMMLVHLRYQREATYLVWSIPQPKKKTLFINQQVIHLAKEEDESRVCIISDDTDVSGLLVNLFSRQQIKSSAAMESPIHGRSSIKNGHTTRVHLSGKLTALCTKWIQLTSTAVDRLEHLQQPQGFAVCRLRLFHLKSISVEHITRSLCGIVLSGDVPALNAVEYGWE